MERDSGHLFSGAAGERSGAPRDAATVILLRDRASGSFEVFLMRRHRNQAFMGGAHVFPGGSLDDADRSPVLAALAGGFSAAAARCLLQEPDLPEATAIGLFMAAIRETFEEAGVLLARNAAGGIVEFADPDAGARFAALRAELHAGRLTLAVLADRQALCYAPDLLVPYAHWITPEIEPRRFDTRFFLARLPEGQLAVHDCRELTESCWMTPASAIAENAAGRIALMPPTLKTMEDLVAFTGTDQLFAAIRSLRIVTILPEAFRTADGFGVRLPTDPEYSGAGCRQPSRPGETTRIVMEAGIWKCRSV